MSQNEEPKPRLPPEARLELIKKGLAEGWTQEEIAVECGVCRKTIGRQIRAWELSGGFEDWVRRKFREQFDALEGENVELTFKEISKLTQRTMTQRTEARVEGFELRLRWTPGDEEDEPAKPS